MGAAAFFFETSNDANLSACPPSTRPLGRRPGLAPMNAPVAGQRQAKWILLAEDDHGVQATLTRFLQNLGFEVALACNGEQAFAILDAHSESTLAAIFVDGQMPVMDGHRFLQEVGQRRPALLRKTVWISGDRVSDYAGLAAAFVPKPLWPKSIKEALTRIGAMEEEPVPPSAC